MQEKKKKIYLIGGSETTEVAKDILRKLEGQNITVEIKESEGMKISPDPEPMLIEKAKLREENRSLKPHRGKHRTPQNKYR